jgi:DNA-binding LytR/AlgR family response regulator
MLRCLVIDDEPLALNILADYIRKTEGLYLIDITTNPLHGLQRVKNNEADIVFLDIQMPQLNGIEFLKQASNNCQVILTTAYTQYALQGYEYSVVDYLLKPVSYERFLKALAKIRQAAPHDNANFKPDFFFVKSEYKLIRIDYRDVLYLESLRDYTAIHTTTGQKILTLQSLAYFEKELPANSFIRIQKSYIAAIGKISVIEKNRVLVAEKYLPVGETYRQHLKAVITK